MTIRDVSSHEEIDKLLKPSDPEQARSRAALDRAHAALDQLIARHDELVGPYKAAEARASDASSEATEKLFGCAPTTTAGLIALMHYLRATDEEGRAIFTDGDDLCALLDTIEQSICALAGMKEPQPAEVA